MRIIWKSAVSLALVASMAAGMMLPVSAAAATGLDVENAVTLEANEWYTPLARRMQALVSSAVRPVAMIPQTPMST